MTPEDIAYLRQTATQKGYNPDDLLKAIQYESSGSPDVWGGKNNNYYGIIQYGPNERAKYHIDTQNPSARNQIDGMFGFLHDRGFKPGMGILDLYSTINAGSPGHYNASDGNGTVASHVQAMLHGSTPHATGGSTTPVSNPYNFALNSLPAGMMQETSSEASPEAAAEAESQRSRQSLMASLQTIYKKPQSSIDPQQMADNNQSFQNFANEQHQKALGLLAQNQRGLLGA
jgi:hypothetical protein